MASRTIGQLSFRGPAIREDEAPFADRLPHIGWRKSVAAELSQAARSGRMELFGAALRAHAVLGRKRRGARMNSQACDVMLQPLWSLRAFGPWDGMEEIHALAQRCAAPRAKTSRKRVARISSQVVARLDEASGHESQPIEELLWLSLLAYRSDLLTDAALARVWSHALMCALRRVGGEPDFDDPATTVDQRVLLAGELPFLAGLVFQEVRGARRQADAAAKRLCAELDAGTDTDGTPHGRLLERFTLWLSPFCRAAHTGGRFESPWWDDASQRRFADLVQRSAAMTRSTGEPALSNGAALAPASLLKSAALAADLKAKQPPMRFLQSVPDDAAALSTPSRRRGAQGKRRRKQPTVREADSRHRPAAQSDWAQLACLRNNWNTGADSCVIAYHGATPCIDLTAFGTCVLSGRWDVQCLVDGSAAAPEAEWECVCWFSDRDVDYIELQGSDERATVLRQAMLSRTDHLLYLADSLRAADDGTSQVEHSLRLPLVEGAEFRRDAATREWELQIGSLTTRLLPISLEQQTTRSTDGTLDVAAGSVHLTQSAAGPGVTAALLLDWSPARRAAPALWRRLTVAEDGRAVSRSEASGFHVRIGRHQWLFYRSLIPGVTARTVLGQHTLHEAALGEMTSDGDFLPLVEVEA